MKKIPDFKPSFELKSLQDIWNVKEKLHEDLQDCVYQTGGPFGQQLSHPLIVDILYNENSNARLNQFYKFKLEAIEHAKKYQDWNSYAFLYERPYRLQGMLDAFEEGLVTNNKEFWKVLGAIWTDSENIWQCKFEWYGLLKDAQKDPDSKFFMTTEDRKLFKKLPSELEIYRGYHIHKSVVTKEKYNNKFGFSWTVNKEKAQWFADRYQREGKVAKLVVPREEAFAFLNSRKEEEIVLFPEPLHRRLGDE